MKRLISALRRLLLGDPARAAARRAEDIAMGIVPASLRHDRELVARMQRAAAGGGAVEKFGS